MKKIIAAILAILCVACGTMQGVSPALLTPQTSVTANAASAVEVPTPGINAKSYKYTYADSSVYTTKISLKKDTTWTNNGNTYGIYEINISHSELQDGKKTTVNDAYFCRIGLTTANTNILDFSSENLVVPAEILEVDGVSEKEIGNKVAVIADSAFGGKNSYLKTIDLTGVEFIGSKAFQNCAYITEITIPETVKYIGSNVFDGSGLKTLHVKCELPVIPDYLCQNTKLTDIDLAYPKYVRVIGTGAFKGTPVAAPIFNDWGEAAGYEKLVLNDSAYQDCTSIKKVTMSDNITLLNKSVFAGCTSISDLKIGKNVYGIDKESFKGCVALKNITFNDKLESMGGGVFESCTSLIEVKGMPDTIGDWIASSSNTGWGFGNYMFKNCISLKHVELPKDLTLVPEGCFYGCSSLVTVVSNDGDRDKITKVGKQAFYCCTSLLEALYPNVTEIDEQAFKGCSELRAADMPLLTKVCVSGFEGCQKLSRADFPYLVNIEKTAFKGCSGMKEFNVGHCKEVGDNALESCSGMEEITLLSDKYGKYVFKDCSGAKKINVNCAALERTVDGLFYGCSSLKEVGGDLSKIVIVGNNTFEKCTSLEDINLKNVRIVEASAFSECSSLKSICEGAIDAEDYGAKCFYKCTNLNKIVKGDISTVGASAFQESGIIGVEINGMIGGTFVIGNSAFADCPNLKVANVTSDKDVVFSVGTGVFSNDDALQSVIYAGPIITANMFSNCTSLTDIKTNATSVQANAFAECSRLKDVNSIADPTKTIVATTVGQSAFKNCSMLQHVVSDEKTTYTGTGQYENCSSIKSASASRLTSSMFKGCTALSDVKLTGVTAIPDSAFYDCTSLAELDLKDIITVGSSSFYNSGLKSVVIEAANSVGVSAFAECKNLKDIDIAAESIAAKAFSNDTALEKVVLYVSTVGDSAFSGCASLRSVQFQETESRTLKKIGNNAFLNCNVLYEMIIPGSPTLGSKSLGYLTKSINPDFLLVGKAGSTVQTYAKNNKINFEDISTFDLGARTAGRDTPGDVDGNGLISIADAVKLQGWLLNKKDTYGIVGSNMDLNGDKRIDTYDMVLLRKKLVDKK